MTTGPVVDCSSDPLSDKSCLLVHATFLATFGAQLNIFSGYTGFFSTERVVVDGYLPFLTNKASS